MAESRERVYILSEDYWGFDAASKNDTLNFYDNVWILKKNQYDGLGEEVRNQLYRCALFYHKSRVDNHGYTPLAIRDEGTTVKVRGPNRQGLVEMRTYDDGGQSPPYVVTDGTDTITMRSADPAATDMSQLEAVGANTTPGTFLIGQFIFEEKDILDTINKLESEIGDVINMKTAEFISPTDVLPVPSSYEESRPLAENPQTGGFSSETAPTAPASAAIQVSDPHAANPPAELYSTAIVQQDPTGIEGGYTPQDTFISAADTDVDNISEDKTHKMGPKSATLKHRLSAKARSKARKAARAAKAMDFSAEEAVPLTQEVPMGEEMRQVMTTQAYGQAGGNYDHMIHYSADGVETPGSDDNYVMMPDAGMDILAPANAYGTNSAIVSGQGVPQWYGSAEELGVGVPEQSYYVIRNRETGQHIGPFDTADNYQHLLAKFSMGDSEAIPGGNHYIMKLTPKELAELKEENSLLHPRDYDGLAKLKPLVEEMLKQERDKFMAAESKFDKLAHKISMSYQDKGMSVSEANEVGRKTAAVIGRRKFGSKKFAQMGAKGRRKARRGRKSAESVNPMHLSDNVDETHVMGVPVMNNSWGGDSAGGIGRGAPQWYGSAETADSMSDEEVVEILEEVQNSDWGVYEKYPVEKVRMAMSLVNSRPSLKAWVQKRYSAEHQDAGNLLAAKLTNASIEKGRMADEALAALEAGDILKAEKLLKKMEKLNEEVIEPLMEAYEQKLEDEYPGADDEPEWRSAEVNPMYFEQVDGHDALGVGLPVISNDYGEDSAGGIGRGVPQFYGAEAPASVAVDESSPDSYQPYDFVDEMSPDGEYMTGDDFMTLLSETIDGMGARYKKPSMFQKPVAMVAAGGLMAWLGLNLYNRQ